MLTMPKTVQRIRIGRSQWAAHGSFVLWSLDVIAKKDKNAEWFIHVYTGFGTGDHPTMLGNVGFAQVCVCLIPCVTQGREGTHPKQQSQLNDTSTDLKICESTIASQQFQDIAADVGPAT